MTVIEVVKYSGSPDVFAWKYPNAELGTWTQLIVNESQEAVLYKGGKALDVFGSGTHTLATANIPLLNEIVKLPFGGRSPFSAEVWYINRTDNLDIKWGTPTPIQIQDPKYGVFVPVRANGGFGVRITDSKKFLTKLVGTLPFFDKASIVKYFRSLYVTRVKDAISSYLVHQKISMLEINAYLDELSDYMKERIEPVMQEYGISLVSFYVNDISVPEQDPAVQKLKEALAKRAEMNIIGYSYQQERSFDTMEGAAKNTGSAAAPLMGAGMGLGMGVGLGQSVGQGFGGMAQEIQLSGQTDARDCPRCHAKVTANQRFCATCGESLHEEKSEKSEQPIPVCAACGSQIAPNHKFCLECGKKLNPCPKCGTDLPDGADACPVCAYAIPVPCPQCGAAIPAGVKFCPECGNALAKHCSKCNAEIKGSPKFCPECGNAL